jgi:predicted AAA+ superfamily ATPase
MTTEIDWLTEHAAIWQPHRGALRVVKRIDPVSLEQLLGIERQKEQLVANTRRFLAGLPANNALLWGARGTGKSSLIKAVFNHLRGEGLRLIEVDRDDLIHLPQIVDSLREQPQRFIVYCDDLSFAENERGYRHLKTVLEGSIELPPENVLIYATSNRRHLLPEAQRDNLDTRVQDGEIHYGDAVEEKISLSDRFGLWLSFYSGSLKHYLEIVDSLFAGTTTNVEQLHEAALLFAAGRASRSGRTARQFYNQFTGRNTQA